MPSKQTTPLSLQPTRKASTQSTTQLFTGTLTIKRYPIKPTEHPTTSTTTTQYKFQTSLHFLENSSCSQNGKIFLYSFSRISLMHFYVPLADCIDFCRWKILVAHVNRIWSIPIHQHCWIHVNKISLKMCYS